MAKIIIPNIDFNRPDIVTAAGGDPEKASEVEVPEGRVLTVLDVTQKALETALADYDHTRTEWKQLRAERDRMLLESDKYALVDSTPPGGQEAWLTYRQSLKDVPQTTLDPAKPEWPQKPE